MRQSRQTAISTDAAQPVTCTPPLVEPRHRWWLAAAVMLALGAAVMLTVAGAGRWLSLETVAEEPARALAYARSHYWQVLALAMLANAASTALSVPGAWARSVTIGFLLGPWTGTVAIVASATAGATIVFVLARFVCERSVARYLARHEATARFAAGFRHDAFFYLLFLRLVPLFPFEVVNVIPALAKVRLGTFVAATALGIIPGSYAFASLGRSLGTAASPADLLDGGGALLLAALALLALLPAVWRRGHRR